MLVKDENGAINFIDEEDNFVGFRNSRSCCERFGWHITDSAGEYVNIEEDNPDFLKGFLFNTNKEPTESADSDYSDGGSVGFQLVNNHTGETLCLTLYNHHNGYYAHGWDTSFGHSGRL